MTDNDSVNLMKLGDQIYAMSENDTLIRVDPESLKRQQKVLLFFREFFELFISFI